MSELSDRLRIGMTLAEVKEILGPSPSTLNMFGRQYYVWRRPDGEYKLVFVGNRLTDIYSTP